MPILYNDFPPGVTLQKTTSTATVTSTADWNSTVLIAPVVYNPQNLNYKLITSLQEYLNTFCTKATYACFSHAGTYKWVRDYFFTNPNGKFYLVPLQASPTVQSYLEGLDPVANGVVSYNCIMVPNSLFPAIHDNKRSPRGSLSVCSFFGTHNTTVYATHPAVSGVQISYANASSWVAPVLASVQNIDVYPMNIAFSIAAVPVLLLRDLPVINAIIDYIEKSDRRHMLFLGIDMPLNQYVLYLTSYTLVLSTLSAQFFAGSLAVYYDDFVTTPPVVTTWASTQPAYSSNATNGYIDLCRYYSSYFAGKPVALIGLGSLHFTDFRSVSSYYGNNIALATANSLSFFYAVLTTSQNHYAPATLTEINTPYGYALGVAAYLATNYKLLQDNPFNIPAGLDATLSGINSQILQLSENSAVGALNDLNVISAIPGKTYNKLNYLIWGVRTCYNMDSEQINIVAYKSIGVVTALLQRNLEKLVFKKFSTFNSLSASVSAIVSDVMTQIYNLGGLSGATVEESYFLEVVNDSAAFEQGYCQVNVYLRVPGVIEKLLVELQRVLIGGVQDVTASTNATDILTT